MFGVQRRPEVAAADVLDLDLDPQTFEDLATQLIPQRVEDTPRRRELRRGASYGDDFWDRANYACTVQGSH